MSGMWQQYRKTAVPMQLLILAFCAATYFFTGAPPLTVAVVFVTMQVGAVLGAGWGTRIKRRTKGQDDELPLQRRRQ